jgi:LAS superfamily LD-carboxypeptidase LdcB
MSDWADPDYTALALRMPMAPWMSWTNRNLSRNMFQFSGLFLRPPLILNIKGAPARRSSARAGRGSSAGIPASELTPCATEEETAFKHEVYEAHFRRASRAHEYFPGLTKNLALVEHGYEMRSDAAAAARSLLAAARAELKRQQDAGDAHARRVTSITLTSGYRDPRKDFRLWDSYYQGFYNETRADRRALPGGEHGKQAAAYLAAHIGKYKAAPGYSKHTQGIAFDITTTEGGVHYTADKRQNAAWESTWLRQWLLGNAARFGFHPIATEAWHWEYRL